VYRSPTQWRNRVNLTWSTYNEHVFSSNRKQALSKDVNVFLFSCKKTFFCCALIFVPIAAMTREVDSWSVDALNGVSVSDQAVKAGPLVKS